MQNNQQLKAKAVAGAFTACTSIKPARDIPDIVEDVRVGLPDARYSTCGEMFEEVIYEA